MLERDFRKGPAIRSNGHIYVKTHYEETCPNENYNNLKFYSAFQLLTMLLEI